MRSRSGPAPTEACEATGTHRPETANELLDSESLRDIFWTSKPVSDPYRKMSLDIGARSPLSRSYNIRTSVANTCAHSRSVKNGQSAHRTRR